MNTKRLDLPKLLSCPNCHSDGAYYVIGNEADVNAVYCDSCPLGMKDASYTIQELVYMWNDLPRSSPPKKVPMGI